MQRRRLTIVLAVFAIIGAACARRDAATRGDHNPDVAPALGANRNLPSNYYQATEADIARGGENAPLEMRAAVGAYFMRRGTRTAVMPPWIYAVKRVGDFELIFSGAPSKLADSQFVWDLRTGQIVGTFSGTLPGSEVATRGTATPADPTTRP